MSLITPERVPVKTYRWDDVGAPQLNDAAGSIIAIIKACLITGYGSKEGAGWSVQFENSVNNVEVLRPEVGPHTDFFLRLSGDTGREMTPQVYLNMTNANTGTLKLQCDTAFRYGVVSRSNKWLLVASPRGFWFLREQAADIELNKSGSFLFVGDLAQNSTGNRVVYMQHTGGTQSSGRFATLTGYWQSGYTAESSFLRIAGKSLDSAGVVASALPVSFGDGTSNMTTDDSLSELLVIINKKMAIIPGVFVPLNGPMLNNFNAVSFGNANRHAEGVVFGTGTSAASNFYIATDAWYY